MARDGVFKGVDIALSWHPNQLNSVWAFSTLANVRIHYFFKGVSAHAGTSPHLGRSALDALELMNMGVQFLREHITQRPGSIMPSPTQAETPPTWSRRRRSLFI